MIDKPFEFRIDVGTFDVSKLPAAARDPASDAYRAAVASYFEDQLGGAGRVGVSFEGEIIHVKWLPPAAANIQGYAGQLLQQGDYASGIPLLESVLAADGDDLQALYNLGMAYSDTGKVSEAAELLARLVRLDPENVNGRVALGVAYARAGNRQAAEEALRAAVAADAQNGYAHRNLAAALAGGGALEEAKQHFRRAVELLPKDQQSVAGLAQCLVDLGKLDEADALYQTGIALSPDSALAESMRVARTQIAQRNLRSAGGGFRADAMAYCLSAMESFAAMTPQGVRAVAMEIAMLGRSGLDVNDPSRKYTLRSLPGKDYSGLQLVSMLYVAFKQIDPQVDVGFDLAVEYKAALSFQKKDAK